MEAKARELRKRLDERETPGSDVGVSQRILLLGAGPGVCATSSAMATNPYKEWCEEPEELLAELDKTEEELQKERLALEALQEEARRMGYGSAFYDPD